MRHSAIAIAARWLALGLTCLAVTSSSPLRAASVRVVTTTPTLAAIAREVGGDRVDVEAMARPGDDPHFVSPRPSHVVRLRNADLLVVVGMDLEVGWLPPLLQGSRNGDIQPGSPGWVDASVGIAPLEVPATLTRAEGDVHPYGNPHYWLDPANGVVVARNVAAGLERVDPGAADSYRANLADFTRRLEAAIPRWQEELQPVRGKAVVSYHRTWPYLEQRFGVRFVDELEPKPGIPPSPKHVAQLTEMMRQRDIRTVVHASWVRARAVEELARRVDGRAIELPVEVGGARGVDTYFDLFDHLVSTLRGALSAGDG